MKLKNSKFFFPVIGFVMLLLVSCGAEKKVIQPEIDLKKISIGYYVGDGSAQFYKDLETTEARARNIALKNLAQAISVDISGMDSSSTIEKNGDVWELFVQNIKTSISDTKLVNVETYKRIVDPRTSDVRIILRMNQAEYEMYFEEKSKEAKAMAVKHWTAGNIERSKSNVARALEEYSQSFSYLLQVRPDDYEYEYPIMSGRMTDLYLDIRKKISDIMDGIRIDVLKSEGDLVAGMWEQQNVTGKITYRDKPVVNFPVSVNLDDQTERFVGDMDGNINIQLTGQRLKPGPLRIIITPDLQDFLPEAIRASSMNIASFFRVPMKEINTNVRPVKVYLNAREESDLSVLQPDECFVSQTIKKILARELSWEFVDYQYQSDFTLKLHVKAYQSQVDVVRSGYLYTYRTNVSMSLINSLSGEEIISWIQDPPSKSGGHSQMSAIQNSLRTAKQDIENRFGMEFVNLFRENRLK